MLIRTRAGLEQSLMLAHQIALRAEGDELMTEMNPGNESNGNFTDALKDKAGGLAQAAKERARNEAESGKKSAAGTIDQLASAVDHARDDLSESPTLSQYVGELSGSMHGLADRLRSRSIDELASDARDLARRNPTVFIAGSIAIGLLAARFLKATTRRSEQPSEPEGIADPDLPVPGIH
ncbi:MAG: hypothetical protein EOP61_30840 [Sphingomonadales bacterium]|nr:MAG: hypothetical protein EOP61_30840 [Sphingomonadales bacterium]